tara:strand:+ start:538 stop:753 length:216 start_codon:yes stop_codon:yes gene_type:complete
MYGDKQSLSKEQKEATNLVIALRQVDNIVSLLEENEWRNYLYNHLSPVRYELERQLTNLKEKQSNGKEVQD